jgi:ABC-type uncharacterized transport system permease subunit
VTAIRSFPLLARIAFAVAGTLLVGLVAILSAGLDPVTTLDAIIQGAFGSDFGIRRTLTEAAPITLTALGVAVAFRGGLFNLGGEGQIYVGALGAVLVALTFEGWPAPLLIPACLLAGIAFGLIWGGIAGVLRARLRLSEIITTIMLNFIAFWIVSYLVRGPMKDPGGSGYPQSREIGEAAQLPALGNMVPLGALLMVLAAVFVWVLLERTNTGIRIKGTGESPSATRFAGVSIARVTVLTMAIAGALGGLAGAVSLQGDQEKISDFFSPGWGFDAVAVALIGRGTAAGTLAAGLAVGALRSGIQSAEGTADVPVAIAQILLGAAVLFVIIANSEGATKMLQRAWVRTRGIGNE